MHVIQSSNSGRSFSTSLTSFSNRALFDLGPSKYRSEELFLPPHSPFLALLTRGHIVVAAPPLMPDSMELGAVLEQLDQTSRMELAGTPPELDLAAGIWALCQIYRSCQFLVHREVDPQEVASRLAEPCPSTGSSHSVCYSVDLAFSYLIDVISLARGIAPGDPLVHGLLSLARAWPLSSVGVRDVDPIDISDFVENASLMQLYVDRIIQHKDISRLDHPRVAEEVRRSLGMYGSLVREVAAALEESP
jgi:hypothetical protein